MNNFAKYVFAHDQQNYPCMTPLYLVNTIDIKENDVQTWEHLKDNLSVSKSEISFASVGSGPLNKKIKALALTLALKLF